MQREVIEPGLICVAKVDDRYYRLQVTAFEASEDSCEVKFLDYGGYGTFYVSDLKQIRSDFLTLPFQVIIQNLYLQKGFVSDARKMTLFFCRQLNAILPT